MADMSREEVVAHATKPYPPAGEMPDGADWPSREQMQAIGQLAAQHGDVKVGRVLGEPELVKVQIDYSNVVVFDRDGRNVTAKTLAPRYASIEVSLDLARELLGDDRVETALIASLGRHGYTEALKFGLGAELGPDFSTALRHLLDGA